MPEAVPQTYANHRRILPLYHFVLASILLINLLWRIFQVAKFPGAETVINLLLAFGFMIFFFYARQFALTAQDRQICLETRLRMAELLPADLLAKTESFTPSQLIALRFASDEELPELCRAVAEEGLTERDAIKRRIRDWRPDHLRV